jgi:hypothetical protein
MTHSADLRSQIIEECAKIADIAAIGASCRPDRDVPVAMCKLIAGEIRALKAAPTLPQGTEPPTCVKVEIMGHPDQPVSARCILSGCQDFTQSATEKPTDVEKMLGAAFADALQEDYEGVTELARGVKIEFPNGEPVVRIASLLDYYTGRKAGTADSSIDQKLDPGCA